MLNDSAILATLKEKYCVSVMFLHGRNAEIPKDYSWIVQWRVESIDPENGASIISARIVRKYKRNTKWMAVREIEKHILDALAEKYAEPESCTDTPAWVVAQALLERMKARHTWATTKYVRVEIPPKDGVPEWIGWLRFCLWTGRELNLRKWRKKNLEKLHASGLHAWVVELNTQTERACLSYASQGKGNQFKSAWFSFDRLHEELVSGNKLARDMKWREREVLIWCAKKSGPSVRSQIEAIMAESEEKLRESAKLESFAEKTPSGDAIQDFGPPDEGEWTANLRQRYVE